MKIFVVLVLGIGLGLAIYISAASMSPLSEGLKAVIGLVVAVWALIIVATSPGKTKGALAPTDPKPPSVWLGYLAAVIGLIIATEPVIRAIEALRLQA